MIPLKKIFPVIVVLITLSLLGIIYIQVSWIRSTAILRKEQIDQRITEATDLVREAMVNRQGTALRLKMDRVEHTEKGLTFDRYEFKPAYIPPVSSRWEISEVRRLISEKLRERKLDTTFGFAVFGKIAFGSEIRMQSGNFANIVEQARYDSAGYVAQYIPLISSFESMNEQSETLVIVLSNSNRNLLASLSWMIIGGILFTVIIVTAFALTIRTMLNQKKLSEIKSDFINNMTHELKTPLATISLAIDAIGNEKVMDNRDKIRYFSGIIKEENKRMNKQVESILQSALLEKNEITLNLQVIDAHQVIQHTVENLQLQLAAKGGKAELRLDAINPIIKADDVHFSNLIFNLLDNAIKYSRENLEVIIGTHNTRKHLVITVTDNGIGMTRDTISRIFEKFYRAHTGNVHNVKGFGLGLAYVKAIVDAHKGKIKVDSTVGKGSKFTLEFPQE